jgi:SWI/SNF-related matrix-associated actin-dependent regulator 1 of chromatin subfamily A
MFKKGSEKFDPKCCIYIMSYDLASKKGDEIMEKQFKVAIADEAHYLKSRDAKRTKTLIPILTSCKRVILISGTPMISRPVEVFNILKILRPDIIDTFNEFAGRYCDP